VVTAAGDLLYVQGLGEPKLPLLVLSDASFASTATANAYRFVTDDQGRATHLIVRGDAGAQQGVRKED
jgi:hypothetical protein